jgi:hypothetical protein
MTVINAKPSLTTVYEQDYLLWLEMTSEQLRTGKLENLDIENLLEEIEAMARKEKVALESKSVFEKFLTVKKGAKKLPKV